MADTVKIFGSNVPKSLAIGGAGVIVIGGVYYYRKNKQTQAAQASVTTAGTDAIDPATGYPYGSAEDAAALQTQNAYIDPNSPYSYTGAYSGGYGSGISGSAYPGGGFVTNAEWSQYVEQYLVNTMYLDSPTVGNAIGKYISGQPLTDSMVAIVQSAIAIGGYPPVAGANGKPPAYATSTTGAAPAPTPTKYADNPPKNLHITKTGSTGVSIQWSAVNNATSYTVHRIGGGGLPDSKSNTNNTWFNLGSLKPNTSYTIQVWANPTPTGGPHAQIVVKTTK